MRRDRHRNLMPGPLLPRPLVLHRPIPAPVDVGILREVIERLNRTVKARCDVMPAIVLRQPIGATGTALKTSRSELRWRKNQDARNSPSSFALVDLIVIAVAKHVPPSWLIGLVTGTYAGMIAVGICGVLIDRWSLPAPASASTAKAPTSA